MKNNITPSPLSILRVPAEWENQEALILALPHAKTDWADYLSEILDSYEKLIKTAAKYQKVYLVAPKNIDISRFEKIDNTHILYADTNDTWIRDFGPIDVFSGDGVISYDFTFNAWGNKFAFELDNAVNKTLFSSGQLTGDLISQNLILEGGSVEFSGDGVLLTTEECLLNSNRNGLNKADLEIKLKEIFGLKKIIWLKNGFIKGDDTDSHIDTLARFIAPNAIAYAACDDENDEHFAALKAMENELQATDYELIKLPIPSPLYFQNRRLAATYCNFIFINNALILPIYGDEKADKMAFNALNEFFKQNKIKKEIIAVDARVFIRQNGSLHCASINRFLNGNGGRI